MKDIMGLFRHGSTAVSLWAVLAVAAQAGPSGNSSSGSPGWSNAVQVLMVGGNLSKSSTHGYFNRFGITSDACPSGPQYSEIRVLDSDFALAKVNGLKAILLSAMATGAHVKVYWEGPYCWVSDVILCASADNCPTY